MHMSSAWKLSSKSLCLSRSPQHSSHMYQLDHTQGTDWTLVLHSSSNVRSGYPEYLGAWFVRPMARVHYAEPQHLKRNAERNHLLNRADLNFNSESSSSSLAGGHLHVCHPAQTTSGLWAAALEPLRSSGTLVLGNPLVRGGSTGTAPQSKGW